MTAGHEHEAEGAEVDPVGAGPDGHDPLMAAILGEPLADADRADPARLAAHRAATADVALLREQLSVLAGALTAPEPERSPAPEPERAAEADPAPVHALPRPRRRRLRPLALGAVGMAAAGALVLGGAWLVSRPAGLDSAADRAADSAESHADGKADQQKSASGAGGHPFGDPAYLACARLVIEGDVTRVEQMAGAGLEHVTVRLTRSYKPPRAGGEEVGFVRESAHDQEGTGGPPWRPAVGDHVVLGFAKGKGAASPDAWAVGAERVTAAREALTGALPGALGTRCT